MAKKSSPKLANSEKKYGHLKDKKAQFRNSKKTKKENLVHGRELFDIWQAQVERAEENIKKTKKSK